MRTSVRRALAAASALVTLSAALLLGTATPAAAEGSDFCPENGSVRLVTLNDGNALKIWLYQTNGDLHVCFNVEHLVKGDLILRGGVSAGVGPQVDYDIDAFDCTWILHLEDPAELIVKLNPSLPGYFCIGVNDRNIGISINPGNGTVSPSPELWLDDTLLAFELCFFTRPYCGSSAFPMRFL